MLVKYHYTYWGKCERDQRHHYPFYKEPHVLMLMFMTISVITWNCLFESLTRNVAFLERELSLYYLF
jgi:hypothetical protein